MKRRAARAIALAAVLLLLGACAVQRVKPLQADATSLARQAARERTLAAHPAWALQGRLGISDTHDSGSGSLEWTQHGAEFRFSVHAPVTGKTWILSGDPQQATLEGLHAQPVRGRDAAQLLERELGWRVPMAELVDWVRGARAPGEARIQFRADGLPAEFDQAGWKVQFLEYDRSREPALPSRVFASKGDYKVRLAIHAWTLP
ncbi:MAG: lipoprotein insertase outer membrane protein LolB [Lysobacterales bacterium]